MKTIAEIRWANLNKLVEDYGSIAELNRRLGRKPDDTTLGVILRKVVLKSGKTRGMGDSLARDLETGLALSEGWMDADHSKEVDYFSETKKIYPEVTLMQIIPLQGAEKSTKTAVFLESGFFEKEFPNKQLGDFRAGIAGNESMSPVIRSGDRVLIDITAKQFTTDGIYVVNTRNTNIIRNIGLRIDGKYRIYTNESNDDPILLDDVSSLNIVGKICYIWSGRHT